MLTLLAMITERYIAIVYSLKYVRFMTTKRIAAMVAASWGIPVVLFGFRWMYDHHYSKLSEGEERAILIVYTLLFEIAPTVVLVTASLHILLITRKRSLQMSALLIQVRFNQESNSMATEAHKAGLKLTTVRLVTAVVTIFAACYGTEIYVSICEVFELCEVTVSEKIAFSLFLMINSALNPLVYAFYKQDMKSEARAMFLGRRPAAAWL